MPGKNIQQKYIFILGIAAISLSVYIAASGTSEAASSLSVCGTLTVSNETYTLTADLASSGTCLVVAADNVVIDLNGFTVTYGSGGAAQAYGVQIGSGHSNLRVTNGSIRQSPSAGSFAHAVYASSGSNDEFDHLNLEVYSDSSAAIQTWWGTGHHIHDNSITSHVATIQDRHQNQGYDIQLWNGGSFDVHDNTIVGGAQGGIFYYHSDNTRVYNNDISQGGQAIGYSNDFCIGASGGNSEVYGNTCHPVQGRGIHLSGIASKAYNNTINVIELENNAEYGGCQAGGTYGIQIEYPATNLEIYNNTVLARADACDAQAFRATQISEGDNCRVYGNNFSAQRVGSGIGRANAISAADVSGGLTVDSNTLTGDSSDFSADWDGASNIVFSANTVARGQNPSSYYTIDFANGGTHPSLGNVWRDAVYQNGADDTIYRVRSAAFEYTVQWTLAVTVRDQSGTAISQASVGAFDSQGTTVFSGQTDGNGMIAIPLNEYRRYNQSGVNYVQTLTPHSITVTKQSYDPMTVSVTMDHAQSLEMRLTGGLPDSDAPNQVSDLSAT